MTLNFHVALPSDYTVVICGGLMFSPESFYRTLFFWYLQEEFGNLTGVV